jgi:hypothetical protein
MRVELFYIESKSKRGFEKIDMHVVIIIELTSIHAFQLDLIPIFFHMDSIKKIQKFYLELEVCYHCCHCHWCKRNRG